MKNRMRICRAELDWTQAQLENGKYDPALPLAFRISRAFGKNVEEVFIWEETAG
jgi:putative transcriptional regulator